MNLIETNRLVLRQAKQADFETLYSTIFAASEVSEYIFTGGQLSYEHALGFFKTKFNFDHRATDGLGVLIEKSTTCIIGFAGLISTRPTELEGYEFGYVLSKRYWGQGYATEIGQGQIDWAFNDLGLKKIYALIHPQNKASINVAKKLNLLSSPSVLIAGQGVRLVYTAIHPKSSLRT